MDFDPLIDKLDRIRELSEVTFHPTAQFFSVNSYNGNIQCAIHNCRLKIKQETKGYPMTTDAARTICQLITAISDFADEFNLLSGGGASYERLWHLCKDHATNVHFLPSFTTPSG